jgi:large subunit ribosomal protein L5
MAEKEAKEKKAPKKGGGKPKGVTAPPAPPVPEEPAPVPNLKLHYEREVIQALEQRFGYDNRHRVPRLIKIVLNMGTGDALTNPRFVEAAAEDLGAISGQKPSVRRARKSIANFKLRAGVAIGAMVTLRGARMYEFMERLISVAIPRIRDFRGLSPKGFDGRGNFSFGVKEQIIFPEIKYDKVEKIRGLDVTLVTSADTDEEGYELLKAMRMPFRER